MAISITYKGNEIANFNSGTRTLETSGKYCEDDITVSGTGGDPYEKWRNYIATKESWTRLFTDSKTALTDADLVALNFSDYSSAKTDTSYMFYECTGITEVPIINTSSATTMRDMFNGCIALRNVNGLDFSNATSLYNLFRLCLQLERFSFSFNTPKATDLGGMFVMCNALKEVHLTDTSKATNVNNMFQQCYTLETIDTLDFTNVVNTIQTFYRCDLLKNIRFKLNTVKVSFGFPHSSKLANNASDTGYDYTSLISIANGLNEDVNGQTLTLQTVPKSRIIDGQGNPTNYIMGTVDLDESQTYHVFTEDPNGTVPLATFITNTKGWSIG